MKIANCPHCGGPCHSIWSTPPPAIEWPWRACWAIKCDQCGYKGPDCMDMDEAVRAHNKIAQNCGVVC